MITKTNIELDSGVLLKTCYIKTGKISLDQDNYKASYSYHADPEKEALQWDYLSGVYTGGNLSDQVKAAIEEAVENG